MIDKQLAQLRADKGVYKKEVAKYLDVHESTYGKYELGHRTPDLGTVAKLADYFDVTADYLIGRTDTPHPREEQKDKSVSDNPDIRIVARAGKRLSVAQAAEIRRYAEFMFPEAFQDEKDEK